jgi:hypothetical protein
MVRPEIDNESDIELSDRDASLKRVRVSLQSENQRLRTLVVTLTKTVLENVVSNATNKTKENPINTACSRDALADRANR